MNYYKLDNKSMDTAFLKGEEVECRIALTKEEQEQLKIGDALMVMLSNGAKYKGKIVALGAFTIGDKAVGEMKVVRVVR